MNKLKAVLVCISILGIVSCAQGNKNDNQDLAVLAVLLQTGAEQKTQDQVRKLFSVLYPFPASASSSARSLDGVDPSYNPFAAITTQACQLGGTQTIDGTMTNSNNGDNVDSDDLNWTYDNCKENTAGSVVDANGVAVLVPLTYSGTVIRTLHWKRAKTVSGNFEKSILSGTDRIRSSNYTINNEKLPTFDLTFTRNDSIYSQTEYSPGKIKAALEEHVTVVGSINGEAVNMKLNHTINFSSGQ